LSAAQADKVHVVHATQATLATVIDMLKSAGSVRSVQVVEAELQKEVRKERGIVRAHPAVAEAFARLRAAEAQSDLERSRVVAETKDRKRARDLAPADKDAALAQLRTTRRRQREMEGIRASAHAMKSFIPDELGAGQKNAGGKAKQKNRFEILDRLARLNAGLSVGQKNDWAWFKSNWDKKMVEEHGKEWAAAFSSWIQCVLDDKRSNAFSMFVHSETRRVFQGMTALHVPG